jgi:hypothetical protein
MPGRDRELNSSVALMLLWQDLQARKTTTKYYFPQLQPRGQKWPRSFFGGSSAPSLDDKSAGEAGK